MEDLLEVKDINAFIDAVATKKTDIYILIDRL
jgi:hypothetical protein